MNWVTARKALVERSALITSWASIIIALAALGLTIYSGYIDQKYKELAIRPSLHREVETTDFHFAIVNLGVGPAQIRQIATKFHGQSCTYLNGGETIKESALQEVMTEIANYFADPLNQLVQASIWEPKAPKLYVRTLTPDQVVAAGARIVLFSLQEEQLSIVNKNMQNLSGDRYTAITRRFDQRAFSMPLYIEYCSMTGNYCEGGEQLRDACK